MEDDTDTCEAAVGESDAMEEWKAYLTTNEDVPDGMDVVRWWGVSIVIVFWCASLTPCYYS